MADAPCAGRAMIDVDIAERRGDFALDVKFAANAPIVGLFGRSGAGKTTVVNAIAGIGKPSRGTIRVNGHVLFDAARGIDLPPERRRIGYVFQDGLLFPHLDVEANLLYGQRRRTSSERVIADERVIELLGLQRLLRRKPATLSGGEKQRVAIGRALLAQPRILLMDEPLASLDVARRREIMSYVERLRDELAIPIVYVSHAVDEITRLADVIVVLAEGKSVAVGTAGDVLGRLDLPAATGGDEAGAIVEARVARHDAERLLTTLAFDGGELHVPRIASAVGERVRARIMARDVSLALRRPQAISILNVLEGTVSAIGDQSGAIVDVQAAIGAALVNARLTRHSARDLDIRVGRAVFVLVKAVALDQRTFGHAEVSG
ncbi:MAG TPA: molybdenum ABC transporter ATP-binding protein [Casimicrobiaceae bacterium]|nr:molybdenum ABC transporter ATP-binding protein [Casimicrobiaceae bacterium]